MSDTSKEKEEVLDEEFIKELSNLKLGNVMVFDWFFDKLGHTTTKNGKSV